MDTTAPSTRERITAAAFELFLNHGYDGTGVNQVLAHSGLSKGAFYHHFKSKDDIYEQVINDFFLKPLEMTDFDKMATLPLRDIRAILADYYASLPADIKQRSGIDMTRYYVLFFEAMLRMPDFRKAVRAYYLTLIEVLTARTYEERGVSTRVAEVHSRNIVATLEGRLMLNAILGELAPVQTTEPAGELRRFTD